MNNRRGVTLMELVIVIAITGVMATLMGFFIVEAVRTWNSLRFRNESMARVRVAMEQMIRDFRQVNNATSVHAASPTRFAFIDVSGAAIDYSLSGTALMRNSRIAAEGLTELAFTYLSNTSAILSSPAVAPAETDIYRINVTIGVASSSEEKRVTAEVYPRNL